MGAEETIRSHKPSVFFEHPLHTLGAYNTDEKVAQEAIALLSELYHLFAYPVMDQLYPGYALNMPLDDFVKEFKGYPTNVAAIPKV